MFDLIIANPPYGKIATEIFDTLKSSQPMIVGLDQSADIKRSQLFQYISKIQGPYHCFEDAEVSVYAFKLHSEKQHNQNWDEWSSETRYDREWAPFYKANFARKEPFVYHCWETEDEWTRLFKEGKTFLLTLRTCTDGVHSGKNSVALDKSWNLENKCFFTPGDRLSGGFSSINKKDNTYAAQGYEFKSKRGKENITKWWYSSNIASYLCWGLKKQSFGRGYLPRIDWEREGVEYTDEYVLSQMGLKLVDAKDVSRGLEVVKYRG